MTDQTPLKLFETRNTQHGERYVTPAASASEKKSAMPQISPLARRGCETQQAAARSVTGKKAGAQAALILTALARRGPMIRDRLARITGIDKAVCCARLAELEDPEKYRPAILRETLQPAVRKAGKQLNIDTGVHVWCYTLTDYGRHLAAGHGTRDCGLE